MMTFLLFAPTSTKWLGWRKTQKIPKGRVDFVTLIAQSYFDSLLRYVLSATFRGAVVMKVMGLYLSHLLYGICVNIFIMNRYISKSYTTSKNTIDRQYTERGQLKCQLFLVNPVMLYLNYLQLFLIKYKQALTFNRTIMFNLWNYSCVQAFHRRTKMQM